ncbi:hypothetical protein AKJ09_07109 [Labilithrix luteola]|uniref:Uncharacterized protein n=1 Tax=Labilithrix luteola TaxID=1391654 RepID=A0A0K1Q3N7_9BACT|nr:hypothetical protein AKJ09_07109 [Labilithrix luteola]
MQHGVGTRRDPILAARPPGTFSHSEGPSTSAELERRRAVARVSCDLGRERGS